MGIILLIKIQTQIKIKIQTDHLPKILFKAIIIKIKILFNNNNSYWLIMKISHNFLNINSLL